jgi:hypothetical protein
MSIDKIPDMVDEHFLLDAIESFSITARGLQTQIGVSEVGMACQRCVIRKLVPGEHSWVRMFMLVLLMSLSLVGVGLV